MEQTEIEVLVGEAENRVERLRSLYDQYFMGIERIEPQIARKDVERRIQILRRTQIRNTALRFRFQNVLLRYNTFSAHWMRICRQIEEGTYKHHLRKAKERFDPHASAREAREARRLAGQLEYGDTEPPPPGSLSFVVDDEMGVDVDFEDGVDAPDVRAALRAQPVPRVPTNAERAATAFPPVGDRPTVTPGQPSAPPPLPGRATALPGAGPGPHSGPPPLPGRPTALPGQPSGPPPLPGKARPAAPPLPKGASMFAVHPPPAPMMTTKPEPMISILPLGSIAPAGSLAAASVLPRGSVGPSSLTKAPASSGSPPTKPAPATLSAPPLARPTIEPPAVSDERVRQIYSRYVESRRSLGESTASISMDSMARSLRDSSAKLRQKHAGKNVDFEVQVKDGKTVLKPVVK